MNRTELDAFLAKVKADYPAATEIQVPFSGSHDEGNLENEAIVVDGNCAEKKTDFQLGYLNDEDFMTFVDELLSNNGPGFNNEGCEGYFEFDLATGKVSIHTAGYEPVYGDPEDIDLAKTLSDT